MDKKKVEELDAIITEEKLDKKETYAFIENAFRDGAVITVGTTLDKVLPPISIFSVDGARTKKRETVIEKLTRFFEKFFNISSVRFKE